MTDTSNALELLPCPFCGGEAEISQYGDRRKSTQYQCLECGCNLETGEEWGHGGHWNTRPTITPQQAAKVLLEDDLNISKMAKAMHDGPLGADEHWFSAATEQGRWCIDMVRAALRAIAEQEQGE